MNTPLLTQFLMIFLITQLLGLFAGNYLIDQDISTPIVNDDPQSVDNSFGLIIWILISTAILIFLLRYAPELVITILLKAMESLAVFATAIIVLVPLEIADIYIYAFAISLVLLRLLLRKNLLLRNTAAIVSAAGAGALIGASLGIIPIIVFLILLSAYDFIAVFKTKHMVELAKGITKQNLSFTVAMPTKEHQFELGTGDLVVPLSFAVSTLASSKQMLEFPQTIVPVAAVISASLIGLVATLHYASKRKGVPLPALPLQAILMVCAYAATKLAGF